MISSSHKFIFVHIPKCGGTSMENVLFDHADPAPGNWWIKKYRCYRNKMLFDKLSEFPDYYSFAIVRNPWDRALSAWNHFKKIEGIGFQTFLKKSRRFLKQPDILEKFSQVDFNGTHLTDDLNTFKHRDTAYHIIPQVYFLKNLDFIGRFENMDEDWKIISDKINIDKSLPKLNVHKHEHYSSYYTEKTISIIEELYEEDIKLLNYKFENEN